MVAKGASPRIEKNEVWGNPRGGIIVHGAGTKPVVTSNRLHENGPEGISLQDGATPVMSGNVIGQ